MKKLIIISILSVFFINGFSQRVYTPQDYFNTTINKNIINVTLSPHKLGLGISYISKPVVKFTRFYSIYSSIETGYYDEWSEKMLRLVKFNIGISTIIKNFNLSLSPSFNYVKSVQQKQIFEPVTFEVSAMTKVEKTYLSISIDPILLEAKFGIGIGF